VTGLRRLGKTPIRMNIETAAHRVAIRDVETKTNEQSARKEEEHLTQKTSRRTAACSQLSEAASKFARVDPKRGPLACR
jgi:hypothetical protein